MLHAVTSRLRRWLRRPAFTALPLAASLGLAWSCASPNSRAAEVPPEVPAPAVATAPVAQELIARVVRATGTLTADEQAEVSAEIGGRVVATPVERGTLVAEGSPLVQLSPTETAAQLAEAEANAGQTAAALDLGPNGEFDVERVPEVANARAELSLSEADYARIRSLLDQRVVSQAEYDQRRTNVEAARQRLESARNGAQQRYRAYQASLARVTLARKAAADTTVRAPFAGVVGERRVSKGDYVAKGQVVATVVRVDPLRIELPIPESDVARIAAGQPVAFRVEAYPEREFTGTVRFISPALRTDQRAMTVEAVVSDPGGRLKPGLFATAEIAEPARHQTLLVPRRALREVGNTFRVFVVEGTTLEDRIVATGQVLGDRVAVTSGVAAGEVVALLDGQTLVDGMTVKPVADARPAPAQPAAAR